MIMLSGSFLAVTVLLYAAVTTVQSQCTTSNIDACDDPLNVYTEKRKNGTLTMSDMDNLCSLLPAADQCLENLNCNDTEIDDEIQGEADAHNYLCSSQANKNIFVENNACMAASDASGPSSVCNNTFNVGNPTPYPSDAALCTAAKNYLACLYSAYSECSADDARVLMTYIVKSLQPLYDDEHNCILDSGVAAGGEYGVSPQPTVRQSTTARTNSAVTARHYTFSLITTICLTMLSLFVRQH